MDRVIALALMLAMIASCSDGGGDDPTYTAAPCEGIFGGVYSQCSERALTDECAGAFGFGLLICIGRVCRPEAENAVFECCRIAYSAPEEIQACYDNLGGS